MKERRTSKLREAIKKALGDILGDNVQFSKKVSVEDLHKRITSDQEDSGPNSFPNMCRELDYLTHSEELKKDEDALFLFAAQVYKTSSGRDIFKNRRKNR